MISENIKLIFYGGVGTATGANIMLQYDGKKILIDCGLLQGGRVIEEKNFEPFKYDPSSVDFLLITHAHMDHIGKVSKLVRDGFKGKIFSTNQTKELALPMLTDALKVMQMRHKNKTLFTEEDVEKTMSLWEGRKYGEEVKLFDGCFFEMYNAGHILGSAIVNIKIKDKTIAFTGDLGNSPSPLLPDLEIPEEVDYMVMESVYGDRNHESRESRREKLKQAILDGIKRGGTIVIPAFSIERTQVLLYEINNMIEETEIPQIPVFLDSPLAEKVTHIYKKYKEDFKQSVKKEIKSGDDIFDFPGFSTDFEKTKGPQIILAGSGMSEGGRVVDHESRILGSAEITLILVGYQSVGSLGRALQDGIKTVKINGEKIRVRAKIENITGYSSHADSEHLLEFVEKVQTPPNPPLAQGREGAKLKQVFVIMGEPKSSLFLCQRIYDYLDIEAVYPEVEREYLLN